jgi:CheY-like chemotaxis protein
VYAAADPGADGSTFVITVTDEGEGIPEPDLLRLFEPFERGDLEEGAADPGGLGLGLAVSRQVARRLGGDLTAHNRPEGGACFRFTFHATPSAAASPAPGRAETAACPRLRRRPADPPGADGAAARRRPQRGRSGRRRRSSRALADASLDLAIVDLTMPRMNGLEVLRTVRDGPPAHGAPLFILLTASAKEGLDEEAAAVGAAMVLRKPVSAADLRRAVQRLFAAGAEQASPEIEEALPPALRVEAEAELAVQVARLLDAGGDGLSPEAAHRMAGLAAQFGWPELAAACEQVEADLMAGVPAGPALDALRRAWNEAFPQRRLKALSRLLAE